MTIPKKHPERIRHLDQLPCYAPPGHWGTQNARLTEWHAGGGYEMILGTMTPDGGAERHLHPDNHQAMFILEGEALIEIGDSPAWRCQAGSVIEIPPGIAHRICAHGQSTLRFIVVFSPPLGVTAD